MRTQFLWNWMKIMKLWIECWKVEEKTFLKKACKMVESWSFVLFFSESHPPHGRPLVAIIYRSSDEALGTREWFPPAGRHRGHHSAALRPFALHYQTHLDHHPTLSRRRESHRTGAEIWGKKLRKFINLCLLSFLCKMIELSLKKNACEVFLISFKHSFSPKNVASIDSFKNFI